MEQKTKILLFEDFTKLYGRWNKGEVRKEDEFHSNIEDMKPIDLSNKFPIVFADKDLIVNGQEKFTWYEVQNIIGKIEKSGWRLPDYWEIQNMFYEKHGTPSPPSFLFGRWIPEKCGFLSNKETNVILEFPTDNKYLNSYWAEDSKNMINDSDKNSRCFEAGEPNDYYGCFIRTNNNDKEKPIRIRLVKDK